MKITEHVERDGITKSTRQTYVFDGSPTTAVDAQAAIKEWDAAFRASGFDGKIAELEDWLSTTLHTAPAEYGSKAWYAAAILTAISRVRDARARGLTDLALACAVDVGHLWAEMAAKGWSIVTRGRRIADGSTTGAQTRGDQVRADAARVRQLLAPIVAEAKQREFPNPTAERAWIARQLEATHQIHREPDSLRKILADM